MCNNYREGLGLNCKLYYSAYIAYSIAFVNPSCVCDRGDICSNKWKFVDDDNDDDDDDDDD